MKTFTRFMASSAGRGLRIVAGLGLMVWGIAMGGTGGTILAVVGILPLAAGGLDFCILAPLFGEPLSGKEIRKRSV